MPTYEQLKSGDVKLEFGNQEHIALIDANTKEEQLKLMEDNESILKKYYVEFSIAGTGFATVEALDEEEAIEKANGLTMLDLEDEDIDMDFLEIRLLGEA